MRSFAVALEIKSVLFQYSDYLLVRHTVGVITNRGVCHPSDVRGQSQRKESIRETLDPNDSRTRRLQGALRFKN